MNTVADFSIEKVVPSRKDLEFWSKTKYLDNCRNDKEKQDLSILLTNQMIYNNSTSYKTMSNEFSADIVAKIYRYLLVKDLIGFSAMLQSTGFVYYVEQIKKNNEVILGVVSEVVEATTRMTDYLFRPDENACYIICYITNYITNEILTDISNNAQIVRDNIITDCDFCITNNKGIEFLNKRGFNIVVPSSSYSFNYCGEFKNKEIYYSPKVKDIVFGKKQEGLTSNCYFYSIYTPLAISPANTPMIRAGKKLTRNNYFKKIIVQ